MKTYQELKDELEKKKCEGCDGLGHVDDFKCEACKGTGLKQEKNENA